MSYIASPSHVRPRFRSGGFNKLLLDVAVFDKVTLSAQALASRSTWPVPKELETRAHAIGLQLFQAVVSHQGLARAQSRTFSCPAP